MQLTVDYEYCVFSVHVWHLIFLSFLALDDATVQDLFVVHTSAAAAAYLSFLDSQCMTG